MGPYQMREELKCVLMESGGQCVTVVGIEEKLKLFADNWDTLHVSEECTCTLTSVRFYCLLAAISYRSSKFGDGTLPILAQSYSCTGTESSLTSCSGGSTGYSTCYYGRVAGVRCFSRLHYHVVSMILL